MTDADDGNSDNKAISVQLGWDLTELGNIKFSYISQSIEVLITSFQNKDEKEEIE